MQIDGYHVCGAQFGGPLAMIRDERKVSTEEIKSRLRIFTSSGLSIADVEWDASKRVAGMGWSDQEQLIIVLEDGKLGRNETCITCAYQLPMPL